MTAAAKFPPYEKKLHQFHPEQLLTDKDALQFKGGSDENGETGHYSEVYDWEAAFSDDCLVWVRTNGDAYIADGHQRLGRSKKLKVDVDGDPIELNAYVLREDRGWDVRSVRIFCALKNIAQGGESTKAMDVAKFLRNGGEEFMGRRVAFARAALHRGRSLAKLGDQSFQYVLDKHNPNDTEKKIENWGVAVGQTIPGDDERQMTVLAQLFKVEARRKHMPNSIVGLSELVEDIASAGALRVNVQQSLFTEVPTKEEISLFDLKIDLLSAIRSRFNQEAGWKKVANDPNEGRKHGQFLNFEAMRKRIYETDQMRLIHKKLLKLDAGLMRSLEDALKGYIEYKEHKVRTCNASQEGDPSQAGQVYTLSEADLKGIDSQAMDYAVNLYWDRLEGATKRMLRSGHSAESLVAASAPAVAATRSRPRVAAMAAARQGSVTAAEAILT